MFPTEANNNKLFGRTGRLYRSLASTGRACKYRAASVGTSLWNSLFCLRVSAGEDSARRGGFRGIWESRSLSRPQEAARGAAAVPRPSAPVAGGYFPSSGDTGVASRALPGHRSRRAGRGASRLCFSSSAVISWKRERNICPLRERQSRFPSAAECGWFWDGGVGGGAWAGSDSCAQPVPDVSVW